MGGERILPEGVTIIPRVKIAGPEGFSINSLAEGQLEALEAEIQDVASTVGKGPVFGYLRTVKDISGRAIPVVITEAKTSLANLISLSVTPDEASGEGDSF